MKGYKSLKCLNRGTQGCKGEQTEAACTSKHSSKNSHHGSQKRSLKLEEVLLFLRFVIKILWFQLGNKRCLANMLLPAFWQEKLFTTTRLLLLHSSICFYIQAFPDSTALGTATLVQGKVHISWIIKQNKVFLLSHSSYSVTPLTLFLWKWGSDFNYGSMEISIIWVWTKRNWKQEMSCWLFFLIFKAEVHSKTPQNNTKHLFFNCAFPPVSLWNMSGSTPMLCKLLSAGGAWLYWSRDSKRKGCSLRPALPRKNWDS